MMKSLEKPLKIVILVKEIGLKVTTEGKDFESVLHMATKTIESLIAYLAAQKLPYKIGVICADLAVGIEESRIRSLST
jgi:hypothetical protein